MTSFFMGNSLWQLVKQSDLMSKGVMLVLLVLSLLCWTIFLYKVVILRLKKQQLVRALGLVHDIESLDQLIKLAGAEQGALLGYFLNHNLVLLKRVLMINQAKGVTFLNSGQVEAIEYSAHQLVDEMVAQQESGLAVLSISAAVSPLLGLFGTVWGLVHAFLRISEKQAADIVVVAPGIAEALMTTLAGLLVAIPALVMYGYLSMCLTTYAQRLQQLADRFVLSVQRLLCW